MHKHLQYIDQDSTRDLYTQLHTNMGSQIGKQTHNLSILYSVLTYTMQQAFTQTLSSQQQHTFAFRTVGEWQPTSVACYTHALQLAKDRVLYGFFQNKVNHCQNQELAAKHCFDRQSRPKMSKLLYVFLVYQFITCLKLKVHCMSSEQSIHVHARDYFLFQGSLQKHLPTQLVLIDHIWSNLQ